MSGALTGEPAAVAGANAQFYRAFEALDLAAMDAVWAHDDGVTGYVVIDGEAIATTPGHPFYTVERGWVEAAQLRSGDHVPSATSGSGVVASVTWVRGPDSMYDLTVADVHTFFVGDGGWLVHNCSAPVTPWTYKRHFRKTLGPDGGRSRIIKERFRGETSAIIHRVKRGKELVHQHVIHIGRYGGRRVFPDEWTGIPTVRGRPSGALK